MGCLAAELGRAEILGDRTGAALPQSRWLAAALLFETFVFAPIGAYLQLYHSAWSWMYFVPRERLDAGSAVLAVAAYVGSLLFGYALAAACLRGGMPQAPLLLAAALGVINGVFSIATLPRLTTVATYEGYMSGRGHPMWRDPFGVEMAMIVVLFTGGLAFCYRWGKGTKQGMSPAEPRS